MTGRLRWWCCRLQLHSRNSSAELHTPDWWDLFFGTNELSDQENHVCTLCCHSGKENWMFIFFICITGFIKCLKIDIWICLWWTGKKLVTLLAARIRLQDCSHIKAIDFSWRSWTSFGEGGQQVLHEQKRWCEAGCVYKLNRYLRRM